MNDTTDVIILPDATNNVPAIVNAEELTPRQIVEKLDSYISGQKNAKTYILTCKI